MPSTLESIAEELQAKHVVETSWEKLGLIFDNEAAEEVIRRCPEELYRDPTRDNEHTRTVARANSPACRAAARTFIEPVVDHLFEGDQYVDARKNWVLFGVNYYDGDDRFGWHHDLYNSDVKTIVIGSISGIRRLTVEGYPPIDLEPESIVLLDGAANLWHKAECLEGPSVSVVADVPELLYGTPMSFGPTK